MMTEINTRFLMVSGVRNLHVGFWQGQNPAPPLKFLSAVTSLLLRFWDMTGCLGDDENCLCVLDLKAPLQNVPGLVMYPHHRILQCRSFNVRDVSLPYSKRQGSQQQGCFRPARLPIILIKMHLLLSCKLVRMED